MKTQTKEQINKKYPYRATPVSLETGVQMILVGCVMMNRLGLMTDKELDNSIDEMMETYGKISEWNML